MPPVAPQPVQINCPACNTSFRTQVHTLIDVTEQPELKATLLSGQLNVAVCPQCGAASMLGAPLVYHDAAKQLFLIYFPAELNSQKDEQDRFIGDATSFLMRSQTGAAPKGYLLNPRRFLSLPAMLDAILEADGISREMLDAQRKRVELISQMADMLDDESRFNALVEANQDAFDLEFFSALELFIESTPPEHAASRELLVNVRERLAELGYQPVDEDDEEALAERETAIARLSEVADDELETTVAELRPLIDYEFFQAWTAKIEELEGQGQAAEAARLTERRSRILEFVEELDRQAQALFEAGTNILREVLSEADPVAALQARSDQVDETLIMVISANLGAAQRTGQDELVNVLEALNQVAIEIVQDRLSPEERFINELLMAETPQDSTKLLRTNVTKINAELVSKLNELADQEGKLANKPVADRLRQLAREAGAMLF
jgi:hypothetical protein